ncbi:hypothetical protein [Zavarzinella formosa]|uniref:hypothetical protein n=1 Tax=Zavarzinella formosa TaxID=360055 RepID=UPI0002D801BD|nr:hypothetical protein [Zavarzinella formosa]
MADEQHLNSLNRFRKRSSKLVLEQHSHCEVPAGCGGAILRWRNPFAGRCVRVRTYPGHSIHEYLDGRELKDRMMDLSPGKHVYALKTDDQASADPVVMFHLESIGKLNGSLPGDVNEQAIKIVSSPSGHWRHAASPPETDDWLQTGFDDSAWKPLVLFNIAEPDRQSEGHYNFASCKEAGAMVLGPSKPWLSKTAYFIRFVFEIPAPAVIPGEE